MMIDSNIIDSSTLKQLIDDLCEILRANYIFPDVAEEVCAYLLNQLEGGTYEDFNKGRFLAYALTTHMQEISKDEHLWVRWHKDPLPDDLGKSLLETPEIVEQLKRDAKLENYGIYKVERLAGNIGHIDIRYFFRPEWGSAETLTGAMNLLANMHASIIDLRQCGGGNPNAVALVSSYFFKSSPIHLNSLYWRDEDKTEEYWTLPEVPGQRMPDQPVYILTSKDTFSAGEEFAYDFQALKRATIIGETTPGGAHPGSPHRLHPHFEIFIPKGRAINPITGTNWEGVGVQPDITVSADIALNTAHKLALETILANMGESASRSERMFIEEAENALKKLKINTS